MNLIPVFIFAICLLGIAEWISIKPINHLPQEYYVIKCGESIWPITKKTYEELDRIEFEDCELIVEEK